MLHSGNKLIEILSRELAAKKIPQLKIIKHGTLEFVIFD